MQGMCHNPFIQMQGSIWCVISRLFKNGSRLLSNIIQDSYKPTKDKYFHSWFKVNNIFWSKVSCIQEPFKRLQIHSKIQPSTSMTYSSLKFHSKFMHMRHPKENFKKRRRKYSLQFLSSSLNYNFITLFKTNSSIHLQ